MQGNPSSTIPTQQQRIAAARRAIRGPAPARAPRGLTADQRFIAAARNYRRCAGEYIKAVGAWQTFTATHPHDDPAHQEHHQRVVSARLALNGADEAFSMADHALQNG